MIEIAYAIPWWGYLLFGLVILILVPKGFILIGPDVVAEQKANRVKGSVVMGLARKFDFWHRGFGSRDEYMHWNEKRSDGEVWVWEAWARWKYETFCFKFK